MTRQGVWLAEVTERLPQTPAGLAVRAALQDLAAICESDAAAWIDLAGSPRITVYVVACGSATLYRLGASGQAEESGPDGEERHRCKFEPLRITQAFEFALDVARTERTWHGSGSPVISRSWQFTIPDGVLTVEYSSDGVHAVDAPFALALAAEIMRVKTISENE